MAKTGKKPRHTPSTKVALNEVLRSLQDLVRNELATSTGGDDMIAAAEATPSANAGAHETAADGPAPAPVAGGAPESVTDGPVVPALPALDIAAITGTEAASDTVAGQTAAAGSSDTDTPAGVPPAIDVGTPAAVPEDRAIEPTLVLEAVPAGGVQQSLPNLDAPELAPAAAATDAPAPPADAPVTTTAAAETSHADAAPLDGEQREIEITWDDIPVLEHAIELPESVMLEALAASEPVTPELAAPFAPPMARKIAIQVAARLNIELRKAGKRGLNTAVITRLAQLLQESLAQSAANVDNSGPEQH